MAKTNYYRMFVTKDDGLEINLRNYNGEKFHVSDLGVSFDWMSLDFKDDLDIRLFGVKPSLDIENEGSSKKVLDDITENRMDPRTNDEKVLLNMYNIYNYIESVKPAITHDNIRFIYNMLTMGVDMEKDTLDGNYYRQGAGVVSEYNTLPHESVFEYMSELINFIHGDNVKDDITKSIIIMNQFVLIHPYYDFNGKMSRILMYWFLISKKIGGFAKLLVTSLNFNRDEYFKVLKLQREKVKNNFDPLLLVVWKNYVRMYFNYLTIAIHSRTINVILTDINLYIALIIANEDGEITTSRINEKLKKLVAQGTVSKTLTKLEKYKYISSRKSEKNNVYKWLLGKAENYE